MITDLGPILRKHPFFKDLKEEHLNFIVGCAKNVRFKAGDMIFKEGDPADYFYLIREGKVAIDIVVISETRTITIETVQSGEILGWSWLIPPYRSKFNCRAVEDTMTIGLDGKCLREKCGKDHDLGYELLTRLAHVFTQRLEATRLQLIGLY